MPRELTISLQLVNAGPSPALSDYGRTMKSVLVGVVLLALVSCSTGGSEAPSTVRSTSSEQASAPTTIEEVSPTSAESSDSPSEATPGTVDEHAPTFDYFTWVPLLDELDGVRMRVERPDPDVVVDSRTPFNIEFETDGTEFDVGKFDFQLRAGGQVIPFASREYRWNLGAVKLSETPPTELMDDTMWIRFTVALPEGAETRVHVTYEGRDFAVFGPHGEHVPDMCGNC